MSDTSNDGQPSLTSMVHVDYLRAPEFHVDGLGGISIRNGVAKLNFFTVRHSKAGIDEPTGAVTLSISLADLVAMAGGLNSALAQLQGQGLIAFAQPSAASPDQAQGDQPQKNHEHQHEHNDWNHQ